MCVPWGDTAIWLQSRDDHCCPSGIAIVNRVTGDGGDERELHIAAALIANTTPAVTANPHATRHRVGSRTATAAPSDFAGSFSRYSAVEMSPIRCLRSLLRHAWVSERIGGGNAAGR